MLRYLPSIGMDSKTNHWVDWSWSAAGAFIPPSQSDILVWNVLIPFYPMGGWIDLSTTPSPLLISSLAFLFLFLLSVDFPSPSTGLADRPEFCYPWSCVIPLHWVWPLEGIMCGLFPSTSQPLLCWCNQSLKRNKCSTPLWAITAHGELSICGKPITGHPPQGPNPSLCLQCIVQGYDRLLPMSFIPLSGQGTMIKCLSSIRSTRGKLGSHTFQLPWLRM